MAGLEDFTFHDLCHCAINNLRLAGNDCFKIIAASGHKTMSVFKRYSLVTEEELSNVSWGDEVSGEGEQPQRQFHENMDPKDSVITVGVSIDLIGHTGR